MKLSNTVYFLINLFLIWLAAQKEHGITAQLINFVHTHACPYKCHEMKKAPLTIKTMMNEQRVFLFIIFFVAFQI